MSGKLTRNLDTEESRKYWAFVDRTAEELKPAEKPTAVEFIGRAVEPPSDAPALDGATLLQVFNEAVRDAIYSGGSWTADGPTITGLRAVVAYVSCFKDKENCRAAALLRRVIETESGPRVEFDRAMRDAADYVEQMDKEGAR